MTVRCPQCATIAPLSAEDVGADGAMVRCKACGTRWLARVFDADPYARKPIERMDASDIVDALVIEHVGPGFGRSAKRTRLPVPAAPAPPKRDWRGWKIGATVLGALVAIVLLRSPILAALPGGLPDEVSALEFTSIHSETLHLRNGSTLVVEGEIVNRSATDIALPAIRITLRSPSGDPVSSWLVEPAVAGLGPGKSIGFRSALASPPPDAAQVTLDLAAREGI
ncbi:MAG: DUF3426 domain-containing protein [Bauldia sp.]